MTRLSVDSAPVARQAGGQDTDANVRQMLRAARHAQAVWAVRSVAQRLRVMRRLRHHIARHAAELASSVVGIAQRTCAETLPAEVLPLLDACRFLERQAPAILAPQQHGFRGRPLWLGGLGLEVRREPLGVILIIAPSNYPLFLPGVQVFQALAAGNAVLLKPAPNGHATAVALAHHLASAGLDRRLLGVLPASPEAAQVAIAAGVDKVLLTGSATTGSAVLADLAPRLIPATLELSGCEAAFVRGDANLDLVVRALQFSLRLNGGATCIAPRRVFVARDLAAELETRLVRATQEMVACVVSPSTVSQLRNLLPEACAQGARRVAGEIVSDHQLTPIVVTDVAPNMRLLQADLMAPVLALMTVDDDDEALAAAASCPYALGATVFGRETGARALADRVHAGVVLINDVIVPTADPRLPFGGRGRSGYGVTRGAAGLLELTAIKAVAVRRGRWRPHYEPHLAGDDTLFQSYIAAAHGDSWRERLVAALACWRALLKRPSPPQYP